MNSQHLVVDKRLAAVADAAMEQTQDIRKVDCSRPVCAGLSSLKHETEMASAKDTVSRKSAEAIIFGFIARKMTMSEYQRAHLWDGCC